MRRIKPRKIELFLSNVYAGTTEIFGRCKDAKAFYLNKHKPIGKVTARFLKRG